MKAVDGHDRPREKLQRVGVGALGDNELLAVVLGHGRANASALDLANAVLAAVGVSIGWPGRGTTSFKSLPASVRRGPGRSSRRSSWAGGR